MPFPALTRRGVALAAIAAAATLSACTRAAPVERPAAVAAMAPASCCLAIGRQVAERHRVAAIATRRFTQEELWAALEPVVRVPALRVTEIGRSVQGRPLRAVTYGTGPTTVLLWSQMHGDESTSTMALADLLAWFASPPGGPADDLRARIARELTLVMVPMLNPDGAELFQRENAIGVDVNRDARNLATPEGRALKALRDSIQPAFGFNLHDQGARIRAGSRGLPVAIALLAPALNEERTYEGARVAARQVAAGIATVLAAEIPGRLAKYEDGFNARAFGDLMQQWGTSTVLIESGVLPDDPEKQRLRTVTMVAILSALDAIATGGYRAADVRAYDDLPMNARGAVDVLVRGGQLVLPGAEPLRVDLSLDYAEPVARRDPRVREVGDLSGVVAIDTVDATGLYLHPTASSMAEREGRYWLRVGAPALFIVRRGPDSTSALVRTIGAPATSGR